MARNGSGTMALAEAAFVFDTVIDEVAMNSNLADIAAEITNSVAVDGQSTMSGNLKMGSNKITGLGVGSSQDDSVTLRQVQAGAYRYVASDTGAADAYAIAPSPAIAAYAAGQEFWFISANANTGASTIDVSSLGTKAIQLQGAALVGGEIGTGLTGVMYDGTQFQLITKPLANMAGPASATDNSLARFDGTTGKLLKDGAVIGTDVQAYDAALAALAALTGATDHGIPRWDGTTGDLQDSSWTIDDSDLMLAAGQLSMADNVIDRANLQDTAEKYTALGNLGATETFSFANGHHQSATVDQVVTITMPTDWPATGNSGAFTLELVNGGAFAITWPAAVKWAGGTEPTFTASGTDFVTFLTRDAGTTIHAFLGSLDSS